MSRINGAVEAVMDLIDSLDLYASITRGALGTGEYLSCELGPSTPDEIYMDKHQYIPLDLTINGKHPNLETLSDALNQIHENLTMARSYPSGNGWEIVDIQTMTEPQVIGREPDNLWMMASSLYIKIKTEDESGEQPGDTTGQQSGSTTEQESGGQSGEPENDSGGMEVISNGI